MPKPKFMPKVMGPKTSARRRRASFCCCGVSFDGRPICCPRAFARLRPSAVRVRIRSRSTSASPRSGNGIKSADRGEQ